MGDSNSECLLIVAPLGRDGPGIAALLQANGIGARICADIGEACTLIDPEASALLLTEEALDRASLERLRAALAAQPAWSELPIIVLTRKASDAATEHLTNLLHQAAGSLTVLERPLQSMTLLRCVQVALRSRRRQYQVRDLLERRRARTEKLATLTRLSHELVVSGVDDVEALRGLFAHISAAIGMESFYHFRPDGDGCTLHLVLCGGVGAEARRRLATMRFGELLCGRVAESRSRLVVEDLQQSTQPGIEELRLAGAQSYAGFPLVARGELLGTIAFASAERRRLREGDLQMLQMLCDQIAVTLDRERLLSAAQEANRQKDQFLAMLAHELRNPLAPICNASALLLRQSGDDPKQRAPLSMIARQSRQLTRLVDDLLDVSRIAQGRVELRHETLELGGVLDQALEAVQSLVQEKRHDLRISRPGEPLYVQGDRARLVQSVSNILHNAAKYTDAGGAITVEVSAAQEMIDVRVRDTGVGISPELLPHVFELFVQGQRTLDRAEGGLGIGLSVDKRLIEQHGGRVRAESPGPGQGSVFTLRLPRVAPPQKDTPAPPSHVNGSRRRVLVVDDNRDAADSLALLLEHQGYDVRAAYSAPEALQQARAFDPELMLLDIGLPQMDGYEVARRLRASGANGRMRLIALTGYGQAEDRKRALASGFDAHITKPASPDQLERLLREPAGT